MSSTLIVDQDMELERLERNTITNGTTTRQLGHFDIIVYLKLDCFQFQFRLLAHSQFSIGQ